MKKYHKTLLVVLLCLGGYASQAQSNIYRFFSADKSQVVTKTTGDQAKLTNVRSKANDLGQFFILNIENDEAKKITIQSAADHSLYLGRNTAGKLIWGKPADASDKATNYYWALDFAGIGNNTAGALGYFVLALPSNHERLVMIETSGEMNLVTTSGGLPAGQENKFRFLLEKKANTF